MNHLDKIERLVCIGLLSAIVLLVFAAAVMRTVGLPIIWSVDIAQLLFAWLCMLGANQTLKHAQHATVDIVTQYLPVRWQQRLAGHTLQQPKPTGLSGESLSGRNPHPLVSVPPRRHLIRIGRARFCQCRGSKQGTDRKTPPGAEPGSPTGHQGHPAQHQINTIGFDLSGASPVRTGQQ